MSADDNDRLFAIRHAINRHLPDMARGFIIQTNYGEMEILPGPLADRIRRLIEAELMLKLAPERARPEADEEGGAQP